MVEETSGPRLLADQTVGRLARWMRALGFDTERTEALDLARALHEARGAGRVLVTRNRRAAEHAGAFVVNEELLDRQLEELRRGPLGAAPIALGARCLECNGRLAAMPPEEAAACVPPYVHATQSRFRICAGCRRIYWRGTHWAGIEERLHRAGWIVRRAEGGSW
jgi:uncharacterized protein with PIN domain